MSLIDARIDHPDLHARAGVPNATQSAPCTRSVHQARGTIQIQMILAAGHHAFHPRQGLQFRQAFLGRNHKDGVQHGLHLGRRLYMARRQVILQSLVLGLDLLPVVGRFQRASSFCRGVPFGHRRIFQNESVMLRPGLSSQRRKRSASDQDQSQNTPILTNSLRHDYFDEPQLIEIFFTTVKNVNNIRLSTVQAIRSSPPDR